MEDVSEINSDFKIVKFITQCYKSLHFWKFDRSMERYKREEIQLILKWEN